LSGPPYFSNSIRNFPIEKAPTSNTAKLHLTNIPLIDRENLAGLRPAGALTDRNLSLDIPSPKMNQPKPSQFAAGVKDKAGILKQLCDSFYQTIAKRS
jgi:hypothetical protein